MNEFNDHEDTYNRCVAKENWEGAFREAELMVDTASHPNLLTHAKELRAEAKKHLQKGWLSKLKWGNA